MPNFAERRNLRSLFRPRLFLILFILFTGFFLAHHFHNRPSVTMIEEAKKDAISSQRSLRMQGQLRADEPDEFALYHKRIRTREGEDGPSYPSNYRFKELKKANQGRSTSRLSKLSMADSLDWIERGPTNVAGRTRSIVVDPDDPTHRTWFVGTVGGGVWKTTNGGESWRELTAGLPNLATSNLVMAPSNPDVLYAGTGEGFGNLDAIFGSGIWKSIDRGETWEQLASTAESDNFKNIMRIIVDPNDENIVVVATASGTRRPTSENSFIFRSIDGGDSWSRSFASSNTGFSEGRVEHIVANPLDFNVQYAALNGTGIIKSTDGGISWDEIFNVENFGVARLELAVAPSDTSRVYFAAEDFALGSSLFMSMDAGSTWHAIRDMAGNDLDWLSGQGWYDNTVAVHLYDPNIVYVGGVDLMEIRVDTSRFVENTPVERSQAITSISPVTDAYNQYGANNKGVHPDHHQILLYPTGPSEDDILFLNANDGGISFSEDMGDTFQQTGDIFVGGINAISPLVGLNTSQFYGADKMNGADRYVGGTQDNGSWVSPSDPDAGSSWFSAPSGDGFEAAWHYREPDWIIETSQFNGFFRSLDRGQSWEFLTVPGNGPFLTRVGKSNQDPDLIFAINGDGVVRSDNFGTSWSEINLTEWSGAFGTVRISDANPEIVWAGQGLSQSLSLFRVHRRRPDL